MTREAHPPSSWSVRLASCPRGSIKMLTNPVSNVHVNNRQFERKRKKKTPKLEKLPAEVPGKQFSSFFWKQRRGAWLFQGPLCRLNSDSVLFLQITQWSTQKLPRYSRKGELFLRAKGCWQNRCLWPIKRNAFPFLLARVWWLTDVQMWTLQLRRSLVGLKTRPADAASAKSGCVGIGSPAYSRGFTRQSPRSHNGTGH